MVKSKTGFDLHNMLKQIFYKVVAPIRDLYWFIFRPKTFGVKCLIECNGEVLMIRNTYGKKHWTFPGCGLKKRETPESAVLREILEETGISLSPDSIKKIGEYKSNYRYKRDTVYCFYASVQNSAFSVFSVGRDEILEARWFPFSSIPVFRSSAIDKIFTLCIEAGLRL